MKKKLYCTTILAVLVLGGPVAAEEDNTPPLKIAFVGLAHDSRSTKFDKNTVAANGSTSGSISEFSTGDFAVTFSGYFADHTWWSPYFNADISLQDLLSSGSDTVKTTDKTTGTTTETNQSGNPLMQYQSAVFGFPFKFQFGVMFTPLKYVAVGLGLQLNAIGIKYKDSGISNYSQVKTGEFGVNLQALAALPVFGLFTLYVNPSWSIGTVGSADFLTKAVWGEGPDLGEGKVICRDVTVMVQLFEKVVLFAKFANETRNFNKKLPATAGETTITTNYTRFGAGYAF